MKRYFLTSLLALLLASPAAAVTFNQCFNPTFDCPGGFVEDAGDYNPLDTFETEFDVQGPIAVNRCAWDWEAFYPPARLNPTTFTVNYTPLLEDIDCVFSTGVTPPIGFPNNTGRVFCTVTDLDLTDPFPPVFAPTFGDIIIDWGVIGTSPTMDEDETIVAGQANLYFELIEDQCILSQTDQMQTDIELTVVPEPSFAFMLVPGVALLFGLRRLRGE